MKSSSDRSYLIYLFILLLFPFGVLEAKLFYSSEEYNVLYNKYYALEVELKLIKYDLRKDKDDLLKKMDQLDNELKSANNDARMALLAKEGKIEALQNDITDLKSSIKENNRIASVKIKELESLIDTLQTRSSSKEKELLDQMKEQKAHYLAEAEALKKELDAERLSSNEKVSRLSEELIQWKNQLDEQRKKLADIENQALAMEASLKKEIEEGNLRVKRMKDRLIINIDDKVLFDSGSASLKPEVRHTLELIADILIRFEKSKIVIEGHTDNVPIHTRRFRNNWQLSNERALSVLEYILEKSALDPRRFSAQGFGEFHPVAENDTPQNRQLNRRVDIIVLPQID